MSDIARNPNYNRSLNDCMQLHCAQRGHPAWNGGNPLSGSTKFVDLEPVVRLQIISCLLDWTLTDSKLVKERIEEAYKNRTASRLQSSNPYEVDSIGQDDKKHSYYLLKGNNTRFRLYIQTDVHKSPSRWYSICDNLESLRQLTSSLSDNAKTVRCRKIVDDLASIHIPEVERAEEARQQAIMRKQRANHERDRRHANMSYVEPYSRPTRTRGHRVDYNSMLEGKNDDDDDRSSSRRTRQTSSPELDTPQASRSGRMLKRPRGWNDESPDSELSQAIAASLEGQPAVPDTEDDSLILIFKYNKEKYRCLRATAGSMLPADTDRSLSSEHTRTDHHGTKEAHPVISSDLYGHYEIDSGMDKAQRTESTPRDVHSSTEELQLPSAVPISPTPKISTDFGTVKSSTSTTFKEPPQSTTEQPSTPSDGLRTTPVHHASVALATPKIVPISSVLECDPKTRASSKEQEKVERNVQMDGRALILASLPDDLTTAHVDETIDRAIRKASSQHVQVLDILLHLTPQVLQNVGGTFIALQSAISKLYVYSAKVCMEQRSEMEVTIIVDDWCSYDMAAEQIQWSLLCASTEDRGVLDNFHARHHRHTGRSIDVLIVPSKIPSSTAEHHFQAAKSYNTVAVGGTFDHVHAGHKILLTMTAWLATKKVICGVTGDALLVNKKYKEVMQNIRERTDSVKSFYRRIKRDLEYDFPPIEDVAGPTAHDASIEALVASRETEAGSAQIREIRITNKLPPLDIHFIDVIGSDGQVEGEEMSRLKLSSTAIREKISKRTSKV